MHGTEDPAEGMARLEGYLLLHAEREEARVRAEAFADRMPWLTRAQHEDVVRHYVEDHMARTRETLRAIERRCHELREEYGARYDQLRRRLLCVCVALLLGTGALGSCSVLLSALD